MNRGVLLVPFALVACTETRDGITGTQSIKVTLNSPADPGDVRNRLPDTAHTVNVSLQALDASGDPATDFDATIKVYAQFLGTLTGQNMDGLDVTPLAEIPMVGGVATNQTVTLPDSVLGPTTLWFDNGTGIGPDYEAGAVTGTSPTLWYRDPFVRDIQRPRDETALDALQITPLTDKQVTVSASRHGANGRLVVTSTYAQGYTVSDVLCTDAQGTPPCTAGDYDHLLVFTFSAPRDEERRVLQVGDVVRRFNGGVSEFNGLTEVGFPRTFSTDEDHPEHENNPARLPAPVVVDATPPETWFDPLSAMGGGRIAFERNESGAIEIQNGKVCPLDDDYTTYKQWKIDPRPDGSCQGNNVINLITQGTDFTTDPATLVGQTLPRVVGILRPVNIGTFNVWIVFPRGASDISL